jgi:hypothetical protein
MQKPQIKSEKDGKTHIKCEVRNLITGHVKIQNGDQVIEGKNKLTRQMMLTLINWFTSQLGTDNQATLNRSYTSLDYIWMYLGTDTTTPTNNTTSALTAPIGTSPGTKPSSITCTHWTLNTNEYCLCWTAVWNPGTVTGTVGEIGLYLGGRCNSLYTANSANFALDQRPLQARFAVADEEFDSFTIDTTKPVVVSWMFKFVTDGVFMNNMAAQFANVCGAGEESANYGCPLYNWASKTTYMVIGSDTTTQNTPTMTALTTPIGTAPGTKANTQTIANSTIAEGSYKVTLTATWNAGAVSGTLGEIGLYLYCYTFSGVGNMTAGLYFAARLSHADSHFTSFSINTSNNLVITWEITFTFA